MSFYQLIIFAVCASVIICYPTDKEDSCPFAPRCTCYSLFGEISVQCRRQRLNEIPDFPETVLHVDLSHNFISSIPDNHFSKNKKLKYLDVSFNKIDNLTNSSFFGLERLSILLLQHNPITSYSDDILNTAISLEVLNVKNTSINLSKLHCSKMAFLQNVQADLIYDENYPILPKCFERIKQIDFSGSTGKCRVEVVRAKLFGNLRSVEVLNISACRINKVEIGTFRLMSNLSTLDISDNPCLKFAGLENITQDLPFTSIKVAKANRVHHRFELNTAIKKSHMEKLRLTSLTELHVQGNRIQKVEPGALRYLPNTTRVLDVSDNEFSWGMYLLDVPALNIRYLYASDLFRSRIPLLFEEPCKEKYDNETNTKQNEHGRPQSNTSTMGKQAFNKELVLQEPLITSFESIDFEKVISNTNYGDYVFTLPLPKFAKSFIYRNCRIRYLIPMMNVTENALEILDGAYNLFYSWIGPILQFKHAKYLDLSNNYCSNVSTEFFYSVPNLEVLKIQNNLLGFVLPDDTNGDILRHLPSLIHINLAENRIPNLPSNFFRTQSALMYLNIANNLLKEVNFKLDHMKSLSFLDLSRNRIAFLKKETTASFDQVYNYNENFTIDLSFNDFKCTCETRIFIRWLANTKVNLEKSHKYTCSLSDGTIQSLRHPIRVYEQLEKNCTTYTPLIVTISSFVVLFVSILICGVAYRHRWRLRYMYYMVKLRFNAKHTKLGSGMEKIFMYDAFVSYEESDCSFVHDILLKKLEEEAAFKLCLHKRDFLPGHEIAENITSAIHDSKKVIALISEDYLESHWCMFEFNMAKLESIYSRNKENILFLVFLHPISSNKLPLNVLEFVQTQSYIEYTEDEFGNTVFWEKLKDVLS